LDRLFSAAATKKTCVATGYRAQDGQQYCDENTTTHHKRLHNSKKVQQQQYENDTSPETSELDEQQLCQRPINVKSVS
jgi:hypothetical protein